MKDVVLVFEVHQPFRVRNNFFWDHRMFRKVNKGALFDFYFDRVIDRDLFNRVAKKCYFPSNNILLEAIDRHRGDRRRVKVAFSLSGSFLDQCEMFNRDLLESFRQLAQSGCVEFLSQTYYHSLVGFYENNEAFREEVELHRRAISDLLQFQSRIFENTELIFNNRIAKEAEQMGFTGIMAEGADRVLGGRSPNHVFSVKGCKRIKLLLRNYRLTDDVGYRFSARWWIEWPLTADKYAAWLLSEQGDCILIFPDYETFGEHQWPETGIHDFLRHLPEEILKRENLRFSTPSETIAERKPIGEVDVQVPLTTSWAGDDRDTSHWLENTLQRAYYLHLNALSPLVRESGDRVVRQILGYLESSDQLHSMYSRGGSAGEVHKYFNPYMSHLHAYVLCESVLMDLEVRVRDFVVAANDPFIFYEGIDKPTGLVAYSLRGLLGCLERASEGSLAFHRSRGDFERWVELSLHNPSLAKRIRAIPSKKSIPEIRRKLVEAIAESLPSPHRSSPPPPPE